MPGLSDMYDGSETYNSYVQGQMAGLKQRQEESDLNKSLIANQQSQAMNPLLVQHQDLSNQTLGAQLPGVVGTSQSQASKGQIDQATTGDQIANKRSEIYTKMNEDQLKQIGALGQKVAYAGSMLEQVPAAARPAAIIQMAHQYGIDPNHPLVQSLLQANPDEIPQLMQSRGQAIAGQSSDYLQKRAIEQDKTQASIANAKTLADSRRDVADTNAEARIKAAEQKASHAEAKYNLEQKITGLLSIEPSKRTPEQNQQLGDLVKTATLLKSAGSNQLGADVMNGANPATPLSKADEVIAGLNKQQQNATPANIPTGWKQIGTHKGSPVYQSPDGKKHLLEN